MNRNQDKTHSLPDFDPFSRKTLGMQAYEAVRDALMSGRFSPGQKLTIRSLAQQMGASPMPIREALQRLLAEKALHSTPTNRILVPELTLEQLRELREIRVSLEGLLADRAAQFATDADCKEVSVLLDRMRAALDRNDTASYLFANFAFHRRIYQIAKADLTLRVVENLWLLMGPQFVLLAPTKSYCEGFMKAHTRILRAVVKRDGAAARQAVVDDISQAANELALLLSEPHGTGKPENTLGHGKPSSRTGIRKARKATGPLNS